MTKQVAQAAPADAGTFDLGEVLDFMRGLWAIHHGLQSASKRMEASLGVTGPQRLVIRIIGRFPGITAGRLAAVLHIHPSTLTGILGRLEAARAVRREVDPSDGRRAVFRLTAGGRRLNALRSGTVEAAVRRALAKVSPAQVRVTRDVLAGLARELDRAG